MRFLEAFSYTFSHFGLSTAIDLIAIPRFLSKLPRYSGSCFYIRRLKKHLRTLISEVIEKYKKEPLLTIDSHTSNSVYSLWWDSDSKKPEVVDVCLTSLKNNLNGRTLIVLDKNNYKDFIQLPDHILRRVEKNEISLSHLSDIIRLSLLSEYGGTWIDSCLFCIKPLEKEIELSMPSFPSTDSLNQGKWCFGYISAPSHHKLIRFMMDALLKYWKIHDAAIDYLMFDGFMMIAYEEFPDIRAEIDRFQVSSPDLHRTRYLFDKPIDELDFKSIIENNRFISLTWRIDYSCSTNGKQTYYGALNSWMKERKGENK